MHTFIRTFYSCLCLFLRQGKIILELLYTLRNEMTRLYFSLTLVLYHQGQFLCSIFFFFLYTYKNLIELDDGCTTVVQHIHFARYFLDGATQAWQPELGSFILESIWLHMYKGQTVWAQVNDLRNFFLPKESLCFWNPSAVLPLTGDIVSLSPNGDVIQHEPFRSLISNQEVWPFSHSL